jgi:myo-inositol-1(or 4)-monophosphatase
MINSAFQGVITLALHKAGEILLRYLGRVSNVKVKESLSSVVSEADVESERIIIDLILHNFPEHNIISEESGFTFQGSPFTWVIDPLDGTSNFVAGLPWFGILIAVMKDHIPVAAGAYLPVDEQLYSAEEGQPALLNGRPIRVSRHSELKDILAAYSLDHSSEFQETLNETWLIARLVQNVRNIRSTNCLLDFCYIADGRLGAAINQREKIWDIAAPWLIVKQSGGVITDLNGNELDFTLTEKDYDRDFPVVAANPLIHRKIIELMKKTDI